MPYNSCTIPAKTRFGGVPIKVANPPIEALNAIESIKALPNIRFSSSGVLFKSFICLTIAIPMGSIITAVAVFDIHMDKKAVAIIKPKIIFRTSVPIKLMMFKAIRLCKFHFSMESASIKPPK